MTAQPAPEAVVPDPEFIREIVRLGGHSLQQCFQCGTCSVVCNLSPVQGPFPRKEMLWAQWGLKDRLLQDSDIWLCHGCSDCSASCPRGARPGDVMAAVRSYAILHLATPSPLAGLFSKPTYLHVLVAIPMLLLLALLAAMGTTAYPAGEIVYTRFIPLAVLAALVSLAAVFALSATALGSLRLWKNVGEPGTRPEPGAQTGAGEAMRHAHDPRRGWAAFASVVGEVLRHSRFRQCGVNKSHSYAHLGILYGFILLIAAHLGGAIYPLLGREESEVPLSDPMKVVGNLGALLLVAGCTAVIWRRVARKESAGKATYYDWFFIAVLTAVGIAGLLAQSLRYAGIAAAAYPLFLVHLVLVLMLLIYAPFSRFAHAIYRTVAMTYARQTGRDHRA
ncbi:MAG: quinone-interacting membrane-bound oxidoreductase complex subunit QmoC [Chloroflexi bacterium]|nr:quinone-interacting membrane-bound oxidoreductase complex subunit QmoC [Chloroflexota bacterium]